MKIKPTIKCFIKHSCNKTWLNRVKKTDYIQFSVLFNNWKREKFKCI